MIGSRCLRAQARFGLTSAGNVIDSFQITGCSVPESAKASVVSVWRRIGLWFVCLLVAAALFSLFLSFFLNSVGFDKLWLVLPIFRVTMMCALPIWCLCLPIVVGVKNPEGWKIWTILVSGSLTGPILVGLWFLILQMGGANPQMFWQSGRPAGWAENSIAGMIFAFIVGLCTSSFYLVAFKVLHRRSMGAQRKSAQI
jgi:hypothetical protein